MRPVGLHMGIYDHAHGEANGQEDSYESSARTPSHERTRLVRGTPDLTHAAGAEVNTLCRVPL
jgi:hypothetical protein